MNLSKIAVGLAVSLCIMSNSVLADTQVEMNVNNLALTEKAKNNFLKSYNDGDLGNIITRLRKSVESSVTPPKESVKPPKKPSSKGMSGRSYKAKKKETEQQRYEREVEEKWQELWNKELTQQEKDAIYKAYGYITAYESLKLWEGSDNGLDVAHFYLLDILNDDANQALRDSKMNKKALISVEKNQEESAKDLIQVKKSVDENKKAIDVNKKAIAENTKLIEANKAEIETYSKDVIENNNKVAINQKNIAMMNQQLSDLNKSVKNGLATQSALNGLFQPYNIGKMNVSAALGGYKSHNALAVGAGFRFNKNVAAKAGISSSFDGSALSYNMGVNYEF